MEAALSRTWQIYEIPPASHFDVAASVGLPACSLVITRHFYRILRQPLNVNGPITVSLAFVIAEPPLIHEKHRFSLFIDCFICMGLPAVVAGFCKSVICSWHKIIFTHSYIKTTSYKTIVIWLLKRSVAKEQSRWWAQAMHFSISGRYCCHLSLS